MSSRSRWCSACSRHHTPGRSRRPNRRSAGRLAAISYETRYAEAHGPVRRPVARRRGERPRAQPGRGAGSRSRPERSTCSRRSVDAPSPPSFAGKGVFSFAPPSTIEQDRLARFEKTKSLDAPFTELVLLFADTTLAELQRTRHVRTGADPRRSPREGEGRASSTWSDERQPHVRSRPHGRVAQRRHQRSVLRPYRSQRRQPADVHAQPERGGERDVCGTRSPPRIGSRDRRSSPSSRGRARRPDGRQRRSHPPGGRARAT